MARPSLIIETPNGVGVNQDTDSIVKLKVQAFAGGDCIIKVRLPDAAVSFEFKAPASTETAAEIAPVTTSEPTDAPEKLREISHTFTPTNAIAWNLVEVPFVLHTTAPSDEPILLNLMFDVENGSGENVLGDHQLNLTFNSTPASLPS